MEINGKTSVCGLIGCPVEHTLSPVIHNNLAQMTGENLVYVPFLVEEGKVREAVQGAFALHVKGMNVTVPHKSAVIPYLVDIDPLAKDIGAVNTLVSAAGGYKGYNTDMTGLLRAMQSEGISVKDKEVILLGAGGAARAVAFLSAREGASKIYLANRSLDKAEKVKQEVLAANPNVDMTVLSYDDLANLPKDDYLAIQCTSVGLSPNDGECIISDEAIFKKIQTGVDLIYRPYETTFMKRVRAQGGFAMNGLKMLLYQGIIAYELWNDVSITDMQAEEILQKMKEAMGIHE